MPEPVVPEIVLKEKQQPPENASQANGYYFDEAACVWYPKEKKNNNSELLRLLLLGCKVNLICIKTGLTESIRAKYKNLKCYPPIGPSPAIEKEMEKAMRGEKSPLSTFIRPGLLIYINQIIKKIVKFCL